VRDKKDHAQRDPRPIFRRAAKPITTDYEKAQEAFRKNYERLKTERLAREAATPDDKEPN
jgi:hypothetical protein